MDKIRYPDEIDDDLDPFEPDVQDDWDDLPVEDEEIEVVLEYSDDIAFSPEYADCELRAANILGEYSIEELLDMNEMEVSEAVALLFYHGDLGLPRNVSEVEEIEETEDLPSEEDED